MELNIVLLILIPLVTAFLIPLVDIINIKIRRFVIILSVLAEVLVSLFILISRYNLFLAGKLDLRYYLGGWSSMLGITLVLDSLSLIFSLLISFSLALIIIYSIGFIGHHEGKYYALIFLVLAAMQGTVLTGDIFNLYIFIELITISSAALVAFKRNREGIEATFKYIIYGVIGGLFFLIGVFLIYFNLGSLNIGIIASNFAQINIKMKTTIIALFLTSMLIKMGIFPFHFWLPKAHSICPSSVSALLSGVLLKIYLYVFVRLFWDIFGFGLLKEVGLDSFIIYLALFSSIIGHILALQADDVKKMLAYSSIGHVGIIIGALLLNTPTGLYGGLLHTISHLLLKTTLFLTVGYLIQYTNGHHVADFHGVAYRNPGIFIAFTLAILGMIGIPPLPGFYSKWYILQAFIESGFVLAGLLVIGGSIISLFYYLRFIYRGYSLLDYEKKIKPQRVGLVLSTFYRERIVTDVSYIMTSLLVLSGLFIWLFKQPLMVVVKDLIGG